MATGFSEVEDVSTHNMKLDEMKRVTVNIAMLSRVAESDAHFKHQQRGDPDLTFDEKLQIATQILEKNPATFLSRFGRYLTADDLEYFDDIKDEYEIKFHLKEIRRFFDDKKNETKKRNRRFEAMKKMMEQGEYFSVEEMKERDPLLYDQLIGQFLTVEEAQREIEGKDLNFSAVLIEHVQALANTALYEELRDKEHGQMEEGDSDEEDMADTETAGEDTISKVEKQMLKNEFLRTMQLRFLNGEDDFDYRNVDENEEFDSLDIREQDEEERYFDEEDDEDLLTDTAVGSYSDTMGVIEDRIPRVVQSKDETTASMNCMDCDRESLRQDDSETDLDYNDYVVTTDVCPGLNADESTTPKTASNNKSHDTVT